MILLLVCHEEALYINLQINRIIVNSRYFSSFFHSFIIIVDNLFVVVGNFLFSSRKDLEYCCTFGSIGSWLFLSLGIIFLFRSIRIIIFRSRFNLVNFILTKNRLIY